MVHQNARRIVPPFDNQKSAVRLYGPRLGWHSYASNRDKDNEGGTQKHPQAGTSLLSSKTATIVNLM
jgi:hypothetical protein